MYCTYKVHNSHFLESTLSMAVLHVKHCAKVKGSVSKQISPRMKDIHLVSVQFDYNTQSSVVMIHQFQAVYQQIIVLLYWHAGETISC